MHILNDTGKFHHCTTVRHLTPAELLSDENRKARDIFEIALAATRGPAFTKMDFSDEDTPDFELNADTDSGDSSPHSTPETDKYDHDAFDKYLSTEIILPTGDQLLRG